MKKLHQNQLSGEEGGHVSAARVLGPVDKVTIYAEPCVVVPPIRQ